MICDVAALYEIYERLEANKPKDVADIQFCIDAIRSDDSQTKKLAIQLAFRFFDVFPDKRAAALNALMSQLTVPDVEVQKLVIKGLPTTCLHHADYVDQVGDVLAQLLTVQDNHELLLVRKSLSSILTRHPKASLLAIYCAVLNAESVEEKVAMLKFMDEKVNFLLVGKLSPLMREKVAAVYSEMLAVSTPEEIEIVLRLIEKSNLITKEDKLSTYDTALEQLVEKGIDLDVECANNSETFIDAINNVIKFALILNLTPHSYTLSREMANYLFSKVEKLSLIHYSDRKDILKVLATITHLDNFEEPDDYSFVVKLFDYLREISPDPSVANFDSDSHFGQINNIEWYRELMELEMVCIILYNVLQRKRFIAKKLLFFSNIWKPRIQYLVNVIRVFTQHLKKTLDNEVERDTESSRNYSMVLDIANNVGLIANCFLVNICDLRITISPSWTRHIHYGDVAIYSIHIYLTSDLQN
ncbi:apoptosis inhibitory protein 5 [Dictyocaulus viviparus]|uniref:Apoptosis inhibitory protein 5 n=1 Tax=Dictyocaulus viviparus TaxID=29172 RepID=A0A0D8YB19_DICVI|nr:apoptosis inhibitory protein 5 [Dictyocaulus viviparus]